MGWSVSTSINICMQECDAVHSYIPNRISLKLPDSYTCSITDKGCKYNARARRGWLRITIKTKTDLPTVPKCCDLFNAFDSMAIVVFESIGYAMQWQQ